MLNKKIESGITNLNSYFEEFDELENKKFFVGKTRFKELDKKQVMSNEVISASDVV